MMYLFAAALLTFSPTNAEESLTLDQIEIDHFNELNKLRAKGYTCRLGTVFEPNPTPLVFDCRAWRAAKLHSKDMGENKFLGHKSDDGRTGISFWNRCDLQGISCTGENITAGLEKDNGLAALESLMYSNGHCTNMMNPNHRVVGVGHWYVTSQWRNYWTQNFAPASQVESLDQSCMPASATRRLLAENQAYPQAYPNNQDSKSTKDSKTTIVLVKCKCEQGCLDACDDWELDAFKPELSPVIRLVGR